MNSKKIRFFEGWYFKHQIGDHTLAFIPGHTNHESFIQVISDSDSYQFSIPSIKVEKGVIKAGDCTFSRRGCHINLPEISGQVRYRQLTPLRSDIMGPFQYLPMQCRHGVISMQHTLNGSFTMNGIKTDYTGGSGYIELDSGFSFPRSYLWMQCNDFEQLTSCSIMLSLAHIPFCGTSFTGCICAIIYQDQEYRLATYYGVRILAYKSDHIRLRQGKLLLDIMILPSNTGHSLKSPVRGSMCGTIRESSNAWVHVTLYDNKQKILDHTSAHAVYEYVP